MTATEPTQCPHCRTPAEIDAHFRGGIVNCPKCGRALEVPGRRDATWFAVRIAGVALAVAIGVLVGQHVGAVFGVMAGGVSLGFLLILSLTL